MLDLDFLEEAEQLNVLGGNDMSTSGDSDSDFTIWIGCGKHKWKDCRSYSPQPSIPK